MMQIERIQVVLAPDTCDSKTILIWFWGEDLAKHILATKMLLMLCRNLCVRHYLEWKNLNTSNLLTATAQVGYDWAIWNRKNLPIRANFATGTIGNVQLLGSDRFLLRWICGICGSPNRYPTGYFYNLYFRPLVQNRVPFAQTKHLLTCFFIFNAFFCIFCIFCFLNFCKLAKFLQSNFALVHNLTQMNELEVVCSKCANELWQCDKFEEIESLKLVATELKAE